MNPLILYTILLAGLIIVILIIYKNRKSKSFKQIKKRSTHHELIALNNMQTIISKNNWCVIIRSMDGFKLDYEENDLGKVGYHIYNKYKTHLLRGQVSVYIKDNFLNRYLKIVADGTSDSSFSVDHPVNGYIGYLSFEELN